MKKQCRILMIEKMKPFKILQAIVLLVLSALLNTGCYTATLAPSEDNLRSKQLIPPAGKALVYFYLDGGPYAFIDVAASLNGFKNRISDNTYMLWEVFPGEYLLTFAGGKLEIQCEANQIYYYCVSYASMFGEILGQASDATGRARINEFSLVKWFKDVPAPPETEVISRKEVAADVTEPAEPEKAEVPAQVPPDEAIAILEVKIDKVSDESRTFYDTMGKPIATVPRCVFSPGEHIRSSLIQAKFLIASEDMKETPVATLAVRYQEKNKRPGLGSPKMFFLSYELTHHTRGKLFEGGVGPQGCDTQEQFENHPQFRDIGLLIRDAFIRSEGKAAAAEATGNETAEAEEAVSTAQQAGDPNTDPDKVDTEELKSAKNEAGQLLISNPRVRPTIGAVNVALNYKWKQEKKDVSRLRLSVVITGGGLAPGASYRRWLSPLHGRILEDASECEYDRYNPEHLHFCMQKTVIHFALGKIGIWAVPGLSGSGQLVVSIMDEESKEALSNVLTINSTFSESKESAKNDVNTLIQDLKDVDEAGNASTAQQAGDPNTDSASTESALPGEKSESTTIVTPVPPTSTLVPFAIRDPKFEAAYKGECDTDATIISVEGDSFRAGGQISIRNGAFTLWCYGAKHTWKGKLTYADHVFDSDNESPLQFIVDKDKGYVYLGGKGTVTLPDGTAITLPAEVIGTIRLIMQKDSDVTVTTYQNGSVTGIRDRFEYEPDADIKASLEQMEFEVIPEDSNRPEDATLVVHYEEKKRGSSLDSPTAYYFSFSLSHKTKGTLLEGSAKTTGCDSAEELRNAPQFRDIGVIVRKAFVQEILGHKEAQERRVPTQQQLADRAKSNESVATKHETRIPLSKDDVVKIESISAIVGQGEAFFSKSEKPGMLNAGVDGTIPVVDGKSCLFCVKTITIGPNMKVPLSPFFMGRSEKGKHAGKVVESITLDNIRLTGPGATDDTTEYILSGKNGATLQKESNGFILLEGEAYYVKNVDSKDYMAANKTDNTIQKDPGLSDTLLPPFTLPLKGSNEVRIRNPNDFNVTVGLRSEKRGRDFRIVAYGVASVFVPNGKYEIYFVYSNEPGALFKGDDFSLNGNGVEIRIVKVVGGNYGIKRIK